MFKKLIVLIISSILGGVLGILVYIGYALLPQDTWQQLEQPPERLTQFVANTPLHFFGGEIYASTDDGTLYARVCDRDNCQWVRKDSLPPPPDKTSYWSGFCIDDDKPEGFIIKPMSPGKVVASYETRYCGPDYINNIFFILLDDGSVWVWNKFDSAYTEVQGVRTWGILGLVLGCVSGLVLITKKPGIVKFLSFLDIPFHAFNYLVSLASQYFQNRGIRFSIKHLIFLVILLLIFSLGLIGFDYIRPKNHKEIIYRNFGENVRVNYGASGEVIGITCYHCSLRSVFSGYKLSPEIGQLTSLEVLDLKSASLTALPPEIGQITNLKRLDLDDNKLTELPPEIGQLTNLTGIRLPNNQLTTLPPEFGQLTKLQWRLYLNDNQLQSLPPEFGQLRGITELYLQDNKLVSLPTEIGQLTQLSELHLNNNELNSLPPGIGQLANLESLVLVHNHLVDLPPELWQLVQLKGLFLGNNKITVLSHEIGQMVGLETLDLSYNSLTTLPSEIGNLDHLKALDLRNNNLTTLPPEIGRLTHLEVLLLSGNPITNLPPAIEQLPRLKEFDLRHN